MTTETNLEDEEDGHPEDNMDASTERVYYALIRAGKSPSDAAALVMRHEAIVQHGIRLRSHTWYVADEVLKAAKGGAS